MQTRTWGDFPGGHGLTYHPTRWRDRDYPAQWTTTGWDFEGPGLENAIADDWSHGKPILNLEFGYQHEPGYTNAPNYQTRQVHQPATVRKKAWKIVLSGGSFAAGFESTAVRHFTEPDIQNFRPAHPDPPFRLTAA